MMLARRERGRTVLQATEIRKNRAAAEKALREEERRLAVVKAQKVLRRGLPCGTHYFDVRISHAGDHNR